ncbi:MAG TPA: DUF308 domain-containing protein [Bacteroidales bacterium]|nr:DUF308 domain-containing protein [Bacteroidales bacterium]
METKSYKNWWFLTVNGLVAILFGILLLFFTEETVKTIIMYSGVAILVSGILLFLLSIRQMKKDKNIALLMFQAILSIAIGLIMLLFQDKTLTFFLIIIGVWAIVVGILQLVILINVGKALKGKNVLLFNGLLSMALGVFLILKPLVFADLMVKIVGSVSILLGIGMIVLSILLKNTTLMVKATPGKDSPPK